MKARWTIQWKIPGAVLLFGCVIILVNHWRNERWLLERRLLRLEQEAREPGSVEGWRRQRPLDVLSLRGGSVQGSLQTVR